MSLSAPLKTCLPQQELRPRGRKRGRRGRGPATACPPQPRKQLSLAVACPQAAAAGPHRAALYTTLP